MSELSNKLNGHSGNDELRTPAYLWDWLSRRFLFDLDAAATYGNAKTPRFLSGPCIGDECACGLCATWSGFCVFVNPPYSRPLLGQFIGKAIEERDNADIIVMLVKCDTSTENYRLLEQHAHIEHLRRVRYEDETGKLLPAATFASCVAILRPTEPKP